MTALDLVLTRAEPHGLRRVGPGRWRMRGVCHGGRTPGAVSIAEGDRGAVLLHCFARGCSVDRIAAALGLALEDLFPARPTSPGAGTAPRRRPFSTRDLLDALNAELSVAWVILSDVAAGRDIDARERARAGTARDRCVALIDELRHVQ